MLSSPHLKSHGFIYTLGFLTLSICTVFGQQDDPFMPNNFDKNMGIWTVTQSSARVPISPDDSQMWLMLQKGMDTNGLSDVADPYISTEPIPLRGNCGIDLSFDLFTINSEPGELIYVEVSWDRGQSFQLLKDTDDATYLESGIAFHNGENTKFSFPLRSFISDSLILRLNTHNLKDETKIYLDNLKLVGNEKEDYLLALWQMGDLSSNAQSRVLPTYDVGNCGGVVALPLDVSPEDRHYGIEGYTYDFLQELKQEDQSNNLNNGGLCIDLKDEVNGYPNSISFSIELTPADKGIISGFEFMEKAPTLINGFKNSPPRSFALAIYKEDKLVFSQANMRTFDKWSDRVFRLSHIEELAVNSLSKFTFILTPEPSESEETDYAVWFVDEVKVLGGCCALDCSLIDLNILKEKTEEGLLLTPEIDDSYPCLSACSGSVTNENLEVVSKLSNQSSGWSYYNNANTILTSESKIPLPEHFDSHSLMLKNNDSGTTPYLETDVINLCPEEIYSICFDHIKSGDESVSRKGNSLCVIVDEKCKSFASLSEVDQTCMSFKASRSNHKLQLTLDEKYSTSSDRDEYYLDNVFVEHIPIEEKLELPVDWRSSTGKKFKTEVPEVFLKDKYTFKITGIIDTTSTFKSKKLYSLCFKAKVNTANLEYNELKVSIDNRLEEQVYLTNHLEDYCIEYLSDKREHHLDFNLLNSIGQVSSGEGVSLHNMVILSNEIIDDQKLVPSGLIWTLPDGTTTSQLSVLADQNGEYGLEFTNCFNCTKDADYESEIDSNVCPGNETINCEEYWDTYLHLRLNQPDPPYSIGDFTFEDVLHQDDCLEQVTRLWTVELFFQGEFFDTTTCLQIITLEDTDEPFLPDFETTILSCLDDIPDPHDLMVEDNCTRSIVTSSEDAEFEGSGCPDDPIKYIRYWTAEDACGNSITQEEEFIVIYNSPEITCPDSQVVLCESEIVAIDPDILWDCEVFETTYYTVLNLEEGVAGCNGAVYEMTYVVEDQCMRVSECVQYFSIEGQTIEAACPEEVTVTCLEIFQFGTPSYTLSCASEVSFTYSGPNLLEGGANCDGALYQVVYEVQNICDQVASCTQNITILNAGISITCPDDKVVACPADILPDSPLVVQSCNLSTAYGVSDALLVSGIGECNGAEYELTYFASDGCENEASCIQRFTVESSILTISCPTDITVQCFDQVTPGIPELNSPCDSSPEFTTSSPVPVASSFGCDMEIYNIEYIGTNVCGDIVSCVQNFTLSNSGLSMTCPADLVVVCLDDINISAPDIQSACNVSYFLNASDPILESGSDNCNEAVYIIEYEVEDDCGNSTSCIQSFELENDGLSVICPEDKVVFQFDEIIPDAIGVSHPCGLSFIANLSDPTLETVNCTEAVYTMIYTIQNDCLESVTCDQIITLVDEENAIDSEFICLNQELFEGFDCDGGGINDTDECDDGTDIEDPCDDVTITIGTSDVLCYGENSGEISILTVNGNPPYEFSLDSLSWTMNPIFTNLNAGNYTVYIRSTNGPECFFSSSEIISEPSLSNAEAGDDQEICIGFSATLTASGGSFYLWNTGETSQSITVAPTESTTYIVTVTQDNSCYNTDEVVVIVNENNAASAGDNTEICLGHSVNLEASGGVSYLWSTGNTDAEIEVFPLVTTTYYVTATDSNGCTDTAEVEVLVNSNPIANAGDDKVICIGEQTSLTAIGGVTYEWNTGSSDATILVAPLITTSYSVTVTDQNGCTSINDAEVVVNFNDQADAGVDQAICTGEATTLTATGGMTYVWSTGETNSIITVTPDAVSTYTVTVVDSNGCTDAASVEVVVNALPEAYILGDKEICVNYNATLQASGGSTYLWSTGETNGIITVSPSSNTTYYVTVTDDTGCTDTEEIEVIVHENTSADAGPDEVLCNGESAALQATGGVDYVWSTGETSALITVTPSSTQIYSVTTTDSNGCTDTDELEVVVHPMPMADIGPDQEICIGENLILNATGGTAYLWSTNETNSSIVVMPTVTTTYMVTVTDANGCTDTADIEVVVNALPEASIFGDEEICIGYNANLGASGGSTYLWSTGETNGTITVSPSSNTMYYVTVTDDNGCTDTAKIEVIVHENTSADAGADEILCNGGSAALQATGGVSYIWNTGETSALITVTPSSTQIYSVTTTDSNGCTDTDELEVVVHPLPMANIGPDQEICIGENLILNATGGTAYLWSTNETNSSIVVMPTVTTTYMVTVTDANGCTDIADIEVVVNALPEASIFGDEEICIGYNANLGASGGSTYLWSTGETNGTITVSPSSNTMYYVTVTDDNGCTDTAEREIVVHANTSADAGPDEVLCNGESAALQATGGVDYVWSTGETSALITVTPYSTQIYSVTSTDSNGCTDTDEVEVVVHPMPMADIGPDQELCIGENLILNATGGTAYLWSTNETNSSIVVMPTVTTTYMVTVTDANGCTDTADIEVVVNALPVASILGEEEICIGDDATLVASGGTTYFWSTGETTETINVSPSSTTMYYVAITDDNGCTDTEEIEVIVHENTSADAGPDENICIGGEVELEATGGVSYMWSSGETTAIITVAPTDTQIYSVTTTDSNGCTDTDELEVVVHPLPMADIGPDQEICIGENLILNATGGTAYLWSTNETNSSIVVMPTVTTTYMVTVTDANGCTDIADIEVVVNALPEASIFGDEEICIGYNANLGASGGSTYLWSTGETNGTITLSPSSNTMYYVTVTDDNGCTDTAEREIVVHANTSADAGPDEILCNGGSAALQATGGVSYVWSTGETSALITVTPSSTQIYSVTTTDSNGCTDTDEVEVVVHPMPMADIGPDQEICKGENLILNATGGTAYLWSTNETNSSIVVMPTVTTTYMVTVTDANGCTDTADIEVVVNALPVASILGEEEICIGDDATLVASGGTTYFWSTGETTETINVSPSSNTMYYVAITDDNGCADTEEIEVIVHENTSADAGADENICLGGEVELEATGGVSYMWSSGETTAIITVAPTDTQIYSVTTTDSNGCTDTDELEVVVHPMPMADIGPDQEICKGENLIVNATGGTAYLWSTNETSSSIVVMPTVTTTYMVTVTDANGCTDTADIEVVVNTLPEASIFGDEEICIGYNANLGASGGSTYLWSTGETNGTITVSPPSNTMYYVTVTDGNGCTDTAEKEIVVHSNTSADAGPNEVLCNGEPAALQATGGVDYVWSTGETSALITVAPFSTQIYSVTTTDSNGCTDTDEVEVVVHPLPMADIGPDQEICIGENLILIATGGTAYLWSTNETSSSIVVMPTVTTTYMVTVTDAYGCTDTADIEVVVNALPVASILGEEEICIGDDATLVASGGTTYFWSTGETTETINVSPSSNTMYYVAVTDDNGCTDTAEIEVIVHENTSADAGADENICIGGEVELEATGGVSYMWSSGETTAIITVAPTDTQIYSVTTTDSNGCTDTDEVEVVVHPMPMADIGPDQEICIGENLILNATGGPAYLWSTNETSSSIVVMPTVTTTYMVTVTDANGCTDTADIEVVVNALPVASILGEEEICIGDDATLVASGGTTYFWSTGETTETINVSPSSNTMYYVAVTDDNGCTDTAEIEVIVHENTSADAGADENICIGGEVELEATGGVSYMWSSGETTAIITVAPTDTQIYSVTTTDSNGCTDTDEVEVVVHPMPMADIGPDQEICIGENLILNATGGTAYLWSTNETSSSIVVMPTVTTTYMVTVTDAYGCTDISEVEVVVNALPEASIAGDEEICIHYDATLVASGGSAYLWSTGETNGTITVSPPSNTMYYVTVTDGNGCTDTAEKEVIVHANTSADAGADENICIGGEVELEATGGVGYMWSSGETTAIITVAPTVSQIYTVTTTDSNGCTDTAEVEVVVHSLPIADAGPDQELCSGESLELNASGGTSYLWDTGEMTSVIVVSPDVTTSYSVTITDENGCTSSDSVEIFLLASPNIVTSDDVTLCVGESATLTVSGGESYLWNTGEAESSITVSPAASTTYEVTVTNAEGCTGIGVVNVEINQLPIVDLGADQNICIGEETDLVANGGGTYSWSTGETSEIITVNPVDHAIYSVTVTDDNGCTNEDEVEVFVHDYPEADANDYALACGTNGVTLEASGGTVYLWSTGAVTAVVTVYPTTHTLYSVTVSNDYGCSDVAEVPVYVLPTPVADAGPGAELCPGGTATLNGSGGDEYLWLPNLFLDDNTSPDVVSSPEYTITYTLIVTDESGCTDSDEVTVSVIDDDIPPVAQCMDVTVVADDSGEATLIPSDIDNDSYDNCTPVILEIDETMLACVMQDYIVTLTVTDAVGNSSTCTSTVTLDGPDDDCDFIVNGCDLCAGGDDMIDNNNDGFPDCAYPPDNYTVVEESWKCDTEPNLDQVWVCHSPDESICIDYAEVYTHVSFHQDDYLGPCHAIGCLFDREVNVQDVLNDLEVFNTDLKVLCKDQIVHLNAYTDDLMYELESTVSIEANDCEILEISLGLTEDEIIVAMYGWIDFQLDFQIKDICGNIEKCSSLIIPSQELLGLYPNPTNEWLNISGLENESYVIYNAKSERVSVINDKGKLNVSYLDEGIYILVTNTGRSSRFVIAGMH